MEIVDNSNLCIECNIRDGKLLRHINVIVCDYCDKLDKYTLITKTTAKNDYILTDSDLQDLEYYIANSLYRRQPAKLYNKQAVMIRACTKHDLTLDNIASGIEHIKELKNAKTQERRAKIQATKQAKYDHRKAELVNALQNAGLELRSDSKLCQMYMDGEQNNLESVVKRMCQMKYLYDYCHMNECNEEAYREYCEERKLGYHVDETVSEKAEYIALKRYSRGVYPATWPWQTQNI